MPLIGEGGFGCVFYPSLKCSNKQLNYYGKISKYMSKDHAIDEMYEYKKVGKIDKDGKYHVKGSVMCDPLLESIKLEKSMNKCNFHSKTNIPKSLIISPHGGFDLEIFFKEEHGILSKYLNEGGNKQMQTKMFVNGLTNLFEGIKLFRKKNFIHFDIKYNNILFKPTTYEFKFIDFGISTSKKSLIENAKNSQLKQSIFWSIPYEFIFCNKKSFDNYKSEKINYHVNHTINSCKKINNIFHWTTNIIKPNKITEPFKKKILSKFFENPSYYKNNYVGFINDFSDSIDTYCFGYTCNFIFIQLHINSLINRGVYQMFRGLFKKMFDPILIDRLFDIDKIIEKYNNLLVESKLKIKSECPDGKEINPKTKRCVKICVEGKTRSKESGRCVQTLSGCPADKELNPKTKRCIKKCVDGKTRSKESGRCIKNKTIKNK